MLLIKDASQKKFDANGNAKLDSTEFRNMLVFEAEHFVNPHTLDYFKILDGNDDGQISKAEFSEDLVAMETALGMDVDQKGINSFIDRTDSNGDGHINLGEFYAIYHQRVQWKNISE